MIEISPLPDAAFGAAVRGVDLREPVTPDQMRVLTVALYTHRVIVIKDQRLDRASYLAFGRQWGEPIPHVLDHMRMPGYPELITIGNTEPRDKADNIRNGAALWHTDQSYEEKPASATMLYAIKTPRAGGETQFCDMAGAYEALSDADKTRLDGLQVAHKYGKGRRRAGELSVNPIIKDEQDQRVPAVYHPLVLTHPVTGRKTLYALGHGAYGIRGMDEDAADDLIESLKDHALQERFIYRHRYENGELVVWDTLQTMHRATPIGPPQTPDDERLLWRVSVRGRPRVYC